MSSLSRHVAAGLYAAQEARKDAHAGDHQYATQGGTRFQSAAEHVNTDQRLPNEGAGPLGDSRQAGDITHRETGNGRGPSPHPLRAKADGVAAGSPDPARAVASSPLLIALCALHRLPVPVAEFRFHLTRKWRFDFAWPDYMVALEVEGGVWTNGRHSRGSGAVADMEKYSEAAIMGWRLLYLTPQQVGAHAIDLIARALK